MDKWFLMESVDHVFMWVPLASVRHISRQGFGSPYWLQYEDALGEIVGVKDIRSFLTADAPFEILTKEQAAELEAKAKGA